MYGFREHTRPQMAPQRRRSSRRQLIASLVFILCAFVFATSSHALLATRHTQGDWDSARVTAAESRSAATSGDRGHGSPQPIAPPRSEVVSVFEAGGS